MALAAEWLPTSSEGEVFKDIQAHFSGALIVCMDCPLKRNFIVNGCWIKCF